MHIAIRGCFQLGFIQRALLPVSCAAVFRAVAENESFCVQRALLPPQL